MNISILALKNAVLASIADTRNVFIMVNRFLKQAGKPPLFTVQLVGVSNEIKLNNGLFSIHPDLLIEDVMQTDLIIIPSLSGNMVSTVKKNSAFGSWITKQYKNGAEVAGLCTGAFLLAYTGLLKGRQCTTHWAFADEFSNLYPDVNLVDEKIITDQNGLYSSGGSNAYWNLLLYLVEKYTDRETAIRTAKYFIVDMDRNMQSPFIMFNGRKYHDDKNILLAQEYIEQNYKDKLSVDQIAIKVNESRRTFERRFKKATRYTAMGYIQHVKIEAAKKELETGRKSITEVMSDVGYFDIQTFRDVFKRITGMTPVDYRKKYNKQVNPAMGVK